jgi:putative DNA primase/helicase
MIFFGDDAIKSLYNRHRNKMINVSSETPNKKFVNTDLVKAVVAGDYVAGRELSKKPIKFKSFAKNFLAMNKLPNIDDNTHGMWRRISVINFQRKFEESEKDRKLTEKLKQELSGLFNWAIEGYERLNTRDFNFTESESMRNSKKQYKAQSNSVFDFIEMCLRGSDPEDSISFKDAF